MYRNVFKKYLFLLNKINHLFNTVVTRLLRKHLIYFLLTIYENWRYKSSNIKLFVLSLLISGLTVSAKDALGFRIKRADFIIYYDVRII